MGAQLVVHEMTDKEGDMVFSVALTAATHSRSMIDKLRELIGEPHTYVYVPEE